MTAVGDVIAGWSMPMVDAQRMKTMAAILRDPYPVHWDRDEMAARGFPGVINQGPLNLSYIANMLMAWQGPESIRRLTVSFGRPVIDGDAVVAGGVVTAIDTVGDERHATCDVWLDRDGEHVVTGTAVVALAD
ncbi:MAG: MaoC family dehydratase [Acidimicrobiales bacterium]